MKTNDLHFFYFCYRKTLQIGHKHFMSEPCLHGEKTRTHSRIVSLAALIAASVAVAVAVAVVGSDGCFVFHHFCIFCFFWFYRVSKFWFYADDYKNLTPPMLWYTPQNEATCRQRSYVVKSLNLRVPPVESKHFWLFFDLIKVSRRSAFLWSD